MLPDGTQVWDYIRDWRVDELPFRVWFSPYNRSKTFGDLLWTGGLSVKIASTRMISALRAVGCTGYRTFPVDVRRRDGSPVDGYVVLETDPHPGSDLQNLYGQEGQNFAFVARSHIAEALRRHGADAVEIEPYDPDAGPPDFDPTPITPGPGWLT
ncbi:hypothetical protein ACFEMC_03700 [Kineococcus sp. DHX-1]|uniref:hypothetical protein n=1 Tax=Kineococcus sp. DHX-1 TaxID=3349638 RepID=UPI0036D3AC27